MQLVRYWVDWPDPNWTYVFCWRTCTTRKGIRRSCAPGFSDLWHLWLREAPPWPVIASLFFHITPPWRRVPALSVWLTSWRVRWCSCWSSGVSASGGSEQWARKWRFFREEIEGYSPSVLWAYLLGYSHGTYIYIYIHIYICTVSVWLNLI